MTDISSTILALVFMLAALVLLYRAWARRRSPRGRHIFMGWALLAASMPVWALAGGVDKGPATGIAVLSLAALAVVLAPAWARGVRRRRTLAAGGPSDDDGEPDPPRSGPSAIPWLRRTGVVLLAGPGAFLAAACLTLALFMLWPGVEADRLAFAAFFAPLAWGALACWAVCDPLMRRKAPGIFIIAIIGAAGVAVGLVAAQPEPNTAAGIVQGVEAGAG
ncbi:MAG: hypothetical protein R3C52_13820 [Hyphomonadaceae bacterium]